MGAYFCTIQNVFACRAVATAMQFDLRSVALNARSVTVIGIMLNIQKIFHLAGLSFILEL